MGNHLEKLQEREKLNTQVIETLAEIKKDNVKRNWLNIAKANGLDVNCFYKIDTKLYTKAKYEKILTVLGTIIENQNEKENKNENS